MLSELFRNIEPVNYPEGHKEKPWCPHTKLVEITAALAGVELSPKTLCGREYYNSHYSGGALSRLVSADISPKASCAKINKLLDEQMEIVNEKVEKPSEKGTIIKINRAFYLTTKIKIVEDYKEKKAAYDKRAAIVDRWRKTIFETSVSTLDDKINPHFRQFKTADELSEEEVISKVRHFADALQKIVGYQKETLGWHSDEAENCEQSPHSGHFGVYSD